MATRAWSYFLYDEEIGKNSDHLKIEGIRYIGQTTNPNQRLNEHKSIRPHLAHCKIILLREHDGPKAVLQSVADEFVLFTVKNFFTNLEPDTKPGHFTSPQLNIQARLVAFEIPYGLGVFSDLEKILMREKTIEFPTFECPNCPKEFTRVNYLTRHIKEIHIKRKFFCPISSCSTTTTERRNLYLHIRRVHHRTENDARKLANCRKRNKRNNPY